MSILRALLACALLSPYAQAGQLSAISSVTLDGETSKPGHFIYYGTTDAVMTGLFGWAAAAGGMGPDKEGSEIEARLRSAGFRIETKLRADFSSEIAKHKVFTSLAGGNHTLRLDITRYGMGVAPTGFKRLKPVLEATVTVRDPQAKQVYFLRRAASDMDDFVRGQTYEEYRDNIGWLVRDLDVLSAKLAERLAKSMLEEKVGKPPSEKSGRPPRTSSHRHS